mmetsp:Transcript_55246/g.161212  ORF Transcript_55246/g.161212 Transcript_55246/m.161212 type:complete len:205 (+) Transcript_55246:301-915(+)
MLDVEPVPSSSSAETESRTVMTVASLVVATETLLRSEDRRSEILSDCPREDLPLPRLEQLVAWCMEQRLLELTLSRSSSACERPLAVSKVQMSAVGRTCSTALSCSTSLACRSAAQRRLARACQSGSSGQSRHFSCTPSAASTASRGAEQQARLRPAASASLASLRGAKWGSRAKKSRLIACMATSSAATPSDLQGRRAKQARR